MEYVNISGPKFQSIIKGNVKCVLLEDPKCQEIAEQLPTIPNATVTGSATSSLSCSTCQVQFEDVSQQREHFKLDWHRYNLRLSLLSKGPISDADFDERNNRDELSSISASSSDDDKEDSLDSYATAQGKMLLRNDSGVVFSIYTCLVAEKKEDLSTVDVGSCLERCRTRKWTLLLLGGGHFAGAIFQDGVAVAHKTFHTYTVRKGQGGAQSSKDNKSSGQPKSAGASLRRYNEQALVQHVRDRVVEWKNEIAESALIIYRASGPINRSVLFGGATPLLNKNDRRLRTVPFSTRRATFNEVKRVQSLLATVQVFASLESANAHFTRSKTAQQSQKVKTKKQKKPNGNTEENPESKTQPPPPQSSSSEDSASDEDIELICEDTEVSFKDLNEFEGTKRPVANKPHRKKKPKKSKAKKLREREEKQKSELIRTVIDGNVEVLEELLGTLRKVNDEVKEDSEGITFSIDQALDDEGNTLLHTAVSNGNEKMVSFLLDHNADPCVRNNKLQTPYVSTQNKELREIFKSYARDNPDKYNYNKAQIPTNVPTPEEQAERKKAQRKVKREKEKVKKAENEVRRKDELEKERFLKLSDREKRALAAERRIVNQSGAVISRCFQCAMDITGRVPFEYLGNKFCTVDCVKTHRMNRPMVLS